MVFNHEAAFHGPLDASVHDGFVHRIQVERHRHPVGHEALVADVQKGPLAPKQKMAMKSGRGSLAMVYLVVKLVLMM